MKRMIVLAVLVLAACLIVQVAATGAKDTVERPLKYSGTTNIIAIHLETGDTFGVAFGHSTGVGDFENIHVGQFDFATGAWVGEGIVTAANGDQRFWDGYSDPTTGGTKVTITGGTGRFENVSGQMLVSRSSDLQQTVVWPFLIQKYETTGTGSVAY